MAKKKKTLSYSQMVKKALARAKREANPAAAKMKKKKKLESQAKKMSNKMTSPEKVFAKMMKELDIKVETQKVLGNKIYDFYVPSKNMMVEIDGDYFHANPLIYEQKDLNKMQIRNVRNDKFKDVLAKGNGYEIERVWEYDLNNDYAGQKKRFKKLLKDG
jgi:very-short-patch-repair endonuclease